MSDNRLAPRVLLADDHAEMLKFASSTLRQTCDVVASVSDGREAVEFALRLNPDVVVLDITMPNLDGFQAARELKRQGSRAKVVFLSLHEGDEFVVTAFHAGGQAFVAKQRLLTDLSSAVQHVSAGRTFFPSLSSLSAVATRGAHAVMYYSHHYAWCDQAAGLVRTALTRGDSVTLFAREGTRDGVAKRLTAHGFDPAPAVANGRYVIADAEAALQQLLCDGRPDARSIAASIQSLEDTRLAKSGPGSRMTVIGEIADCLPPGRRDEILDIERLWNETTGERTFLTVCGYSMERFHAGGGDGRPWPSLCAEHGAVSQALDE